MCLREHSRQYPHLLKIDSGDRPQRRHSATQSIVARNAARVVRGIPYLFGVRPVSLNGSPRL